MHRFCISKDFCCNISYKLVMRLLITTTLSLLVGFSTLAGTTDVSSTAAPTPIISASSTSQIDAIYASNADSIAQDPLQMGAMVPSESPRHRQEKAHLMKRMDRKHGKWNTVHPRYRLLEALYGFTKYRERNIAELDRWRSMYANVGKAQKKVHFTKVSQESTLIT
jgi:carnosine N-methyltransferase